jgi:hypothetical protein
MLHITPNKIQIEIIRPFAFSSAYHPGDDSSSLYAVS